MLVCWLPAARSLLLQRAQKAVNATTAMHVQLLGHWCCPQSSMEVAADRRREVELLRQQLGVSEAALQQRRGERQRPLTALLAAACMHQKRASACCAAAYAACCCRWRVQARLRRSWPRCSR